MLTIQSITNNNYPLVAQGVRIKFYFIFILFKIYGYFLNSGFESAHNKRYIHIYIYLLHRIRSEHLQIELKILKVIPLSAGVFKGIRTFSGLLLPGHLIFITCLSSLHPFFGCFRFGVCSLTLRNPFDKAVSVVLGP